jgi:hypothetical protein
MNEFRVIVLRTWTRDGSTNEMGLDEAIENLARNQSEGEVEGATEERRKAIRNSLLAGRALRTENATFEILGLLPQAGDPWE